MNIFSVCPAGYPPLACFFVNIMTFIDAIVVPFIMALAFLVFVWGVFQYFIAGGADEEKRTQGRNFVIWGIIGFVLMISLWGIVNLLINSLGLKSGSRPPIPTFGVPTSQQQPGKSPAESFYGSGGTAGTTYTDAELKAQDKARCDRLGGTFVASAWSRTNSSAACKLNKPVGASCELASDCTSGLCYYGKCAAPGTSARDAGASCTTTSDCNTGLTCDFHASGSQKTCGYE